MTTERLTALPEDIFGAQPVAPAAPEPAPQAFPGFAPAAPAVEQAAPPPVGGQAAPPVQQAPRAVLPKLAQSAALPQETTDLLRRLESKIDALLAAQRALPSAVPGAPPTRDQVVAALARSTIDFWASKDFFAQNARLDGLAHDVGEMLAPLVPKGDEAVFVKKVHDDGNIEVVHKEFYRIYQQTSQKLAELLGSKYQHVLPPR